MESLYNMSENVYSQSSGDFMHERDPQRLLAPANLRWSRSRALGLCPRRYLRILPPLTRPSLFGGD
jgi:hypothetical protein